MRAVTDAGPENGVSVAHQHALLAAGVTGSSADLLNFLRWRALRVGLPLRQITQDETIGATPLAAAWAAEGLQLLLGFAADAQRLTPETMSAAVITADLQAAQAALSAALGNVDLMLEMIAGAE